MSSVKNDTWIDELRANNIILSDIGNKSNSMDILIGTDVAGKLITGKKYNLKNRLTALKTHLGWTVLGKLPKECERSETAVIITTMFVREANLCDLWRLDAIGITDSIEKMDETVKDEQTREFSIKTAKQNANGRYEVRLPWTEDHVPVSSNYNIARNRLNKCLDKLATQNLLET